MLLTGIILSATSCFKDDDPDINQVQDWKLLNEAYILDAEARTNDDGSPYYEKIVPSWAPGTFTLIKWHNDRALTASALSPLDNSIIYMKYEVENINGAIIENSYNNHIYGDSIYRTSPSKMIIGVRAALPKMHVGDSVSLVLPASAAYGNLTNGSIKPYSTLKFNIKLVAIPGYEISIK